MRYVPGLDDGNASWKIRAGRVPNFFMMCYSTVTLPNQAAQGCRKKSEVDIIAGYYNVGPLFTIAKLVNISPITMVYDNILKHLKAVRVYGF